MPPLLHTIGLTLKEQLFKTGKGWKIWAHH